MRHLLRAKLVCTEVLQPALGELDALVWRVDEEVAVARADAAVAVHDFGAWGGKGGGLRDCVCEGTAVAGCLIWGWERGG